MKAQKLILQLTLSLCLIPLQMWAQPGSEETARMAFPSVQEETLAFAKKLKPSGNGLTIVVNANAEELESVIKDKLEVSTGEKVKTSKGLFTLESVIFEDISSRTLDYYYRVEPIGKSDENVSRVSLFVSAGYYNFLDSEKFPQEIESARAFLQQLEKNIQIFKLQEKINAQQELVSQQLKEEADLQKEREKLQKERVDAQDNINKMEAEIESLKAKIADNQANLLKADQAMTSNASSMETQAQALAAEKDKLLQLQAELAELQKN